MLLIHLTCLTFCPRWNAKKTWAYQNGRRRSIKRYDNLMEEIEREIDPEPKIITQCDAVRPRLLCCTRNQVIWKKQKEFEFQHWIDVTEQHLVKTQIEDVIVGELKIEVEFDDEETKESYEQHVQNLVKEAKQHFPNAQINIKQIFQVGEKDIKTIRRSFYGKPFVLLQLGFPQFEFIFKIIKWFLQKIGYKSLLTKEIVVKKVISDRNIEAI